MQTLFLEKKINNCGNPNSIKETMKQFSQVYELICFSQAFLKVFKWP